MNQKLIKLYLFLFLVPAFIFCYKPAKIVRIPHFENVANRTVFIALDGVDYDLMSELNQEGHFQDFLPPIPFISTCPSDTTVGFTGILKPFGVGKVPGYEVRF